MKCPQCNTTTNDSAKFCPICGLSFEIVECQKCSKPILLGSKFCPKCGAEQVERKTCVCCQAELEKNAKFCTSCGTPVDGPKNSEEDKYAAKTLTFGIMGAAFAMSVWLSVLGIIFSAIARGQLKKYLKHSGGKFKDARAGVGNGLSIGGLAMGITWTAVLLSVIIFSILGYYYFTDIIGSLF